MYSGVSMLTLTPLPKVLSMLPPLGELTLGASAMLDLDTLLELELDKAVWTAELIWGWRAART